MRRWKIAFPAEVLRSSDRLRLLRFRWRNTELSDFTNGPVLRSQSPSGGSTLITSAPRSPSCMLHIAPAAPCETSTTLSPDNANVVLVAGAVAFLLPFVIDNSRFTCSTISWCCWWSAGEGRGITAGVLLNCQCGVAECIGPHCVSRIVIIALACTCGCCCKMLLTKSSLKYCPHGTSCLRNCHSQ